MCPQGQPSTQAPTGPLALLSPGRPAAATCQHQVSSIHICLATRPRSQGAAWHPGLQRPQRLSQARAARPASSLLPPSAAYHGAAGSECRKLFQTKVILASRQLPDSAFWIQNSDLHSLLHMSFNVQG